MFHKHWTNSRNQRVIEIVGRVEYTISFLFGPLNNLILSSQTFLQSTGYGANQIPQGKFNITYNWDESSSFCRKTN